MWKSPAARVAPVFPAETTASAVAVSDRAAREDERAVRLGSNRLDGLLVHFNRL